MRPPSSFRPRARWLFIHSQPTVRLQIIGNTSEKPSNGFATTASVSCTCVTEGQADLFIRSLIYYAGFSSHGLRLIRSRRGAIIKTLRRVCLG